MLLASLFSPIVTGFYVLATRVIMVPMRLIGEAVSNVFLQRATGDMEKGAGLARDTTRLFGYMIYLSLPPVLVLLFFGKNLFSLVFGYEWVEAGVYTQILSLSFLAGFLHRPLSTLFDAYERQKQRLIFDSCLTFARVGGIIVVAYIGWSEYIAILVLGVSACITYTYAYFYLFALVGVNARQVLGIFVTKIVVMLPITTGIVLSKIFIHKHPLIVGTTLTFLLILQGFFLSTFDPRAKKELLSTLSAHLKWKLFGRKTIQTL